MALILSNSDHAALRKVTTLLLAPLDAPSITAWRASVLHEVQPLFGSDAGAFVLPHADESPVTLLNRPDDYLRDYTEHQDHDLTAEYHERSGYRIGCTEGVCAALGIEYNQTELYDLVYAKYRVEEGIWTILDVTERPVAIEPGRVFAPRGMPITGMFVQYAERSGHPRFRAEGMTLMSLLQPMLRSASQAWKDLGARRDTLAAVIDQSADAIAIHDAAGAIVHQNPAMTRMLATGTNSALLAAAAREMAIEMSGRAAAGVHVGAGRRNPLERLVTCGRDGYRLSVTAVDTIVGTRGAVLVRIEQGTRRALEANTLRHRFGFTAREADVAILLASGHTNRRIAAALGISEHTARRHTEKVLAKAGVQSRSQIAFRFSCDGAIELAD